MPAPPPAPAMPAAAAFPTATVVTDSHARSVADVASALGIDQAAGLNDDAAARLAAIHGPNALEPVRRSTLPVLLLEAATEPFVGLLAIAGLLAVRLGRVRGRLLLLVAPLPLLRP